ncbi:hypothetical protein WJX73_002210 [Symbiochloris irregularis]|uniref:TFIID subunit TAF5 NTD2 domain-containing protein n=1 Tax=Symbiochloris irregularis TaxID=706552 RepID=A0AAW1NSU1_9CHLO
MGQAALDQLVLSYLSKRKCTNALQAFKQESQAASTPQDMALAPQLSKDKGIVEDLLFYLVAENDTQQYVMGFDRLTAWVDNSLDAYQAELVRLLYPVFIHCYLHLIEKEAVEDAAQLMSKHKKRFLEADGGSSRTRLQELNELQTVAAPEHLKTHRIAQTVQSNRFPVRLSAYSFELLAAFLTSAKPLALLLAIINEHLNVRITDGFPMGLDQEEPDTLELLTGHVPEDVTTKNQAPLNLALLQGSIEHKAAEAEVPLGEGGGKRKGKRPREGDREGKDEPQNLVEATEPEVPVIGIAHKLEAALVKDFKSRAQLSKDALPSAVLFTFLNTHQTLNCVSFAADGSVLAGGFADSSIRMHNVAKAKASDGTVRLWSTEAAANLAVYRGHNLSVWDVAASHHGYFASASADRTARVWVSDRALPLRLLAGHYTDVDVVRWHPSGHFLGTGSSDRTVRLWDLREGQSRRILTGHKAPVTSMAFSPDGNLTASGDENGDVIVWDLRQAARLEGSRGHAAPVWSLAFSQPDGAILASGGGDNAIKLYAHGSAAPAIKKPDQQGLTYSECKKLRTKATPVLNVAFTHRNLLLAGGCLVPPAVKEPVSI